MNTIVINVIIFHKNFVNSTGILDLPVTAMVQYLIVKIDRK